MLIDVIDYKVAAEAFFSPVPAQASSRASHRWSLNKEAWLIQKDNILRMFVWTLLWLYRILKYRGKVLHELDRLVWLINDGCVKELYCEYKPKQERDLGILTYT